MSGLRPFAGCLATALLLAVMAPATAALPDDDVQQADEAFNQGNWAEAAKHYRSLTDRDDTDMRSWFRLGYALHAHGKLTEAIEAHKKASADPRFRPVAQYNHACALSLLGKKNEAIAQLRIAVASGFNQPAQIQGDSDFDNIRDMPEFEEILAEMSGGSPPPPRRGRARGEFNFWIGSWDVVGKDGRRLGTNRITADQKGFVLTENWTSAGGGTGMSINFYDPAARKWKQTWVDAAGGVTYYEGEFKDGSMQFSGSAVQPDGTTQLARMVFTPEDDGTVRQFIEHSSDNGSTWNVYFDGKYIPQNDSGTPAE